MPSCFAADSTLNIVAESFAFAMYDLHWADDGTFAILIEHNAARR
jgi:hypothetical protein